MVGPVRSVVPKFVRRSYALKFMIALLVLGLSVGAIGYLGTSQIADEVEQQVQADSKELARHEAQNAEKWNQLNELRIQGIASQIPDEGDDIDKRQYLHREASEGGVHHVHHVNISEKRVMQSSNTDLLDRPVDEIDQTWAERIAALDDDPLAQEYRYLRGSPDVVAHPAQDGTPVMSYALMTDEHHVVVVSMDATSYADEMIDDGGRVSYLVHEDSGTVAVDPRGQSSFAEYDEHSIDLEGVGNEPAIHEIGTPGDALGSSIGSEYHDEQYIATAVRVVDGSEWVIVVHTPENEAYGFVRTVSEYGIYASLAGTLLVVLVGGVVGRNTSRSIDRLTAKAERMEDGELDVEFETARIDSIGRLYGGFANMRDSLKGQIREARNAREEAEVARAETDRINRYLEAKADEYADVMQTAGDGDLTARTDPESESEAMREIGEEFNEMIAEIERTIDRLTAFADEVATASEQVTASSEEVRGASEQVTESIQEISDGADRQNESLQSVNHEMNGLSTTIEQIAASSNQVADVAEQTAETGERGRAAAQAAIDGMNEIEVESDEAVAEIDRLEAEMDQIDDLIEFITDVAEQTNMLALNANIEAARSGDSSEGFSAVAGEVKELAEETKAAAEDVEERLEGIQAQTERTAEEVQRTSDRVAEHTDSVERAAEALDEIAAYAEETNTGVQEISAASEEQAASTQEVVSMVDEAASISEETSAESENVAAAAEEQTTALTEVSRSASDLSNQASRLSEALDRFETDADVTVDGELPFDDDASTGSSDAALADLGGDDLGTDPFELPDESADVEAFSYDQDVDRTVANGGSTGSSGPGGTEPASFDESNGDGSDASNVLGDEPTPSDGTPTGDGVEVDDEAEAGDETELDDETKADEVFRFGNDR